MNYELLLGSNKYLEKNTTGTFQLIITYSLCKILLQHNLYTDSQQQTSLDLHFLKSKTMSREILHSGNI